MPIVHPYQHSYEKYSYTPIVEFKMVKELCILDNHKDESLE
jgi:hypothetical protein